MGYNSLSEEAEHRRRWYLSKVVKSFFAISKLIELPLQSGEIIKALNAFGGGMIEERKFFKAKFYGK